MKPIDSFNGTSAIFGLSFILKPLFSFLLSLNSSSTDLLFLSPKNQKLQTLCFRFFSMELRVLPTYSDSVGMKFNVEEDDSTELPKFKDVKKMANEINTKLNSELESRNKESAVGKAEGLESVKRNKESAVEKAEGLKSVKRNKDSAVENAEGLKLQLAEKTEQLSVLKNSELQTESRIEELEKKYRISKESEEKTKDLILAQTEQLEQAKVSLEESKLEIQSLHEKLQKCSSNTNNDNHNIPGNHEFESLKFELESTKQNLALLKNELKLATEAEENNKKAMDDLAMALKEVATEANHFKGKYSTSEEELKQRKEETENLRTTLKTIEEKNKTLLQEARKEADLYKSTVDRLRLEAEESLLAWSGRETSLVDCIRRAEDDRYNAQQENRRLMDSLRLADLKNMTSKEEIKKLRDILKQALNEATVAKEAAGIAIEENSQLKDCLVEKENALDFVSTENETLKVSQASALEEIKELKQLLEEATKKEGNGKEESKSKEENKSKEESKNKEEGKEQVEMTKSKPPLSPSPNQNPSPSPAEKEDTFGKRLGKAFSFSFLELRISPQKKEVEEEAEDEEPEMEETLKGSIFDENVDSPGSARLHERRPSLSQYSEDGELMHFDGEDLDQLEEGNLDELEGDRNSRKKKALIRRFGDLLMRRRSFQQKEGTIT